ncbi:DUF1294 domain-containing protein [Lachnospiraceae bacterium 46-15]
MYIEGAGNVLVWLYLLINAVVFVLYGVDKWKAEHHKWRISEAALLGAALFGVFGALLGMYFFRHKIRKPKFFIGVPLVMLLEIAAGYLIWG